MSQNLDNADTVLTIVPAAAAVTGAALTKVVPKSVKEKIHKKKDSMKACWTGFQKTHPKTFFVVDIIMALLNSALYFADIYTDVMLLIAFYVYEWYYCALWSLCFLVIPYVLAMVGIYLALRKIEPDRDWCCCFWKYGASSRKFT